MHPNSTGDTCSRMGWQVDLRYLFRVDRQRSIRRGELCWDGDRYFAGRGPLGTALHGQLESHALH